MLAAVVLAFLQGYTPPASFEPGASKQAVRARDLPLDPWLLREYAALAVEGKIADLVGQDLKWMPYIIEGLISDDEKIARASFQALSDYCLKRQISACEDGFRNPVKLELVNSAYYRAGERAFWGEWWLHQRDAAAQIKWDEVMKSFRGGGAFDDPTRPEGLAFLKVKALGPAAYPRLVSYIENEDLIIGRAAVAVLNGLTGRSAPLPNEATKARRKTEWEDWLWAATRAPPRIAPGILALLECQTEEAEVLALVEKLSDDDPDERRRAAGGLRACVFRHEDLLRRIRRGSTDVETRAGLDEVLAYRESVESALEAVRADPEWLLEGVDPGTPLEVKRKALVEHLRLSRPASYLGRYRLQRLPEAVQHARKQLEDFDQLAKEATLLREEGKKAEALDLLKAARPRFELTRWAERLQQLIEEFDK